MLSGARVKSFVDPESFLIGDIGTGERTEARFQMPITLVLFRPLLFSWKEKNHCGKTLYCFEPGCVTINSRRNQLMLALKFSEIKNTFKKTISASNYPITDTTVKLKQAFDFQQNGIQYIKACHFIALLK